MTAKAQPIVLDNTTWTPGAFKFMPPKVNDKGGKSINLISEQSGRSLHITTPLMTTWELAILWTLLLDLVMANTVFRSLSQ